MVLRVLLVADTHLGFDLPMRPRVERRRRGPDFFANFERALAPALAGEVDLVVHGGDVLYRSKVPARLVQMAFEPMMRVADAGVPVVVVPGNHERSRIPYPLLASHPEIHILHGPSTVALELGGLAVSVAGFPFVREDVRGRFRELVEATAWRERGSSADVRLLVVHQTVEGARVGPVGYTFRRGDDVIRGRDLPEGFAAVLAGHIHRQQVLRTDLAGRPLPAPVFYPGSVERTSSAERDEEKGFMTLEIAADATGGRVVGSTFHRLPARPMIDLELDVDGLSGRRVERRLRRLLDGLDPEAVVRIRVSGTCEQDGRSFLSAVSVRRMAPASMTVSIRWQPAPPRNPAED